MTDTDRTTLSGLVAAWHPAPRSEHDTLDPAQATRLARTLDLDETFGPGDPLPLPWHWIYFGDWPATAGLGADGHPADGHFLPPIPNRRRMFAGARITCTQPLRLGVDTERVSTISTVTEKHGHTGAMLFVTVRTEFAQEGDVRLTEEQDIVYRSDAGHSRPFTRPTPPSEASTAAWSSEPTITAPQLFRYSALTSNAHRIHYDQPYVTQVEGYPDLVVHGPLLATLMADLARTAGGRTLRSFDFRLRKPLFLGDRFRVEATPVEGSVQLRVVTGDDTIHVCGTGEF